MFTDSITKLKISPENKVFKITRDKYDYLKNGEPYEYILTYKFNPIHNGSGTENFGAERIVSISNDANQVSDKYYTLIDILYGEQNIKLINKIDFLLHSKEQENTIVDNINDKREKFTPSVLFKLREKSSNKIVYSTHLTDFILVPYFVKLKELYDTKQFIILTPNNNFNTIDYSSHQKINVKNEFIWDCEVVLISDKELSKKAIEVYKGKYKIAYKMTNNEGQTIILDKLYVEFWYTAKTIENYRKEQADLELKKEELKAKKIEEEKLAQEKEQKKLQKFKANCISEFGEDICNLIVQGKVRLGMTKKMCEASWGSPYDKTEVITEDVKIENWYYSWKKTLHFENGILKRIEK